ncbi:tumor necrosis factor receptor superfamily member 25 [Cricetulus griseus]
MKTSCTEPCGNATCLPCPRGTFLTWGNHFKSDCTRCQACDEMAFQVTLENCSAVSDTRCGCQSGLVCSTEPCREGSPFPCFSCSDCAALPTPGVSTESALKPQTQPAAPEAGSGVGDNAGLSSGKAGMGQCRAGDGRQLALTSYVLSVLWVQLLLGASFLLGPTLICLYCRCQPCKPVVPGLPLTPALSPAPPSGSPAAMLQPGPQLYDVMDAVPARRWKEFVRTLGLREAEIEAVEVEICRFRDQQYEMLKRWRQQQPAGLGAIYAALERMGLEGCAEDLRSRLQHGP